MAIHSKNAIKTLVIFLVLLECVATHAKQDKTLNLAMKNTLVTGEPPVTALANTASRQCATAAL
ncbi:hypothetical protein ACP70R_028160 [Stipagrostis hirtigluma subsp. patula]